MFNDLIDPTVLLRAYALWGETFQWNKLQEECGELVAQVNRWRHGRGTDKDLYGELADVLIICHQVAWTNGGDAVRQAVKEKMARLEERVRSDERQRIQIEAWQAHVGLKREDESA